jgi:DNA-binding MarR family transcriptional regulator
LTDTVDEIDLGPLEGLVGYHVRRAAGSLRSDYDRTIDGTGMRQVLFGILSVVSANPGINQSSVACVLGIPRPNMVSFVNELIGRDLLARAVDSADRRAFTLTLTDAGASAMEEALERIAAHEARMLQGVSAEEHDRLIRILSQIRRNG